MTCSVSSCQLFQSNFNKFCNCNLKRKFLEWTSLDSTTVLRHMQHHISKSKGHLDQEHKIYNPRESTMLKIKKPLKIYSRKQKKKHKNVVQSSTLSPPNIKDVLTQLKVSLSSFLEETNICQSSTILIAITSWWRH